MSEAPRVLVERESRTAVVTLNRPEARNALDLPMVEAIDEALAELAQDEELTAVILTGAGDQAFVSGADIGQLRDRRSPEALKRINQGLFRRVEEFPAPTIAAVRGWALGGGCELAMACDLRVAGESARFGQPEVGLGIIPGAGGTHRLERLVGVGRARELIFTGEIIDAVTAERIGLVNRVVPDVETMTVARELAQKIAKNATLAVRFAKLAINRAPELPAGGRDALEMMAQAVLFDSEEKVERMTRFLERKKKKKS